MMLIMARTGINPAVRFRMARMAVAMAVTATTAVEPQSRERIFVVIVNQARPETDLSREKLVRVFRGETKFWDNREAIRPILPSPDAREGFISTVLKLSSRDYDRQWKERLFRGENTSVPLQFADDREAAQIVFSSPTALAIVELAKSPNLAKAVKILTVDGKAPSDADYGLRW